MAPRITRHFLRVRDREVHLRRAGNGPPFLLFHVSPQHSGFVLPHFLALAGRFTLIGLDSPGYGGSDPLAMANPMAADYADAALETLDELGVHRAAVYGAHTGAHVALELALRHPTRVGLVVLDGLSINAPAEAQRRLDFYAPRFPPQPHGGHLAHAWQHTRDQTIFAPWYEADAAHRLASDMRPAELLHDVVLAKMDARDYALGYRAAFAHDPRSAVKQLRVPAAILARAGDWRADEARRLDLPAAARIIETDDRNEVERIGAAVAAATLDPGVAPVSVPAPRTALWRSYADRGDGQRLVRRGGAAVGKPLVLLHDTMGGSRLLEARMRMLGVGRPVVAPDIAGNADSDPLQGDGESLATYAADTLAALQEAGVTECDLYGEGLGAALALAMAQAAPRAVDRLVLDRPILPAADERAELARELAPPLPARWDGTHLLTAWHMLRDGGLWWPWYRRSRAGLRTGEPAIDPVLLQQRLVEWLKGKDSYGAFARAVLEADTDTLLRLAKPTLILVAGNVTATYGERAARALPRARLETTRMPGDAAAIAAFLDG